MRAVKFVAHQSVFNISCPHLVPCFQDYNTQIAQSSPQINMIQWLVLVAVLVFVPFRLFPYFVQDVLFALAKLKVRRRLLKYMQNDYTILDRFLERVETLPHKPLVYFEDETFTYKDADELSSKAARVFLQSGRVDAGDAVALFVGNEPMFLWLWLGLAKIGCPAAFLNYNIRSKSLLRCFNRSGAKTLVVAAGERGMSIMTRLHTF